MEGRHRIWSGERWVEVPVPTLAGEPLVLPTIAGVVSPPGRPDHVLVQRRDKPGEAVRGLLEVPTGRWRPGEAVIAALRREVEEETGVEVLALTGEVERVEHHALRPFEAAVPLLAVVGVEGAYPTLVVAFACIGRGEPRPGAGESADPRWVQREELTELLDDPSRFTGPSLPILRRWAGG